MAVHNISEANNQRPSYQQQGYNDATAQWYGQHDYYDPNWHYQDLTNYQQPQVQQQHQVALPPVPAGAQEQTPAIHIVASISMNNANSINASQQQPIAVTRPTIQTANIMIDTGAATHVCPLWFADSYPIHPNKPIYIHGVRWVYMKSQQQPIVIPFYVCDVHDPILSVTRLAEQGFDIRFNDAPTMRHNKGFDAKLVQENNLYYLPATIMTLDHNQHLQVQQTTGGLVAVIAPTTWTKTGPRQFLGGNSDYWAYNNEGYLVRYHGNKGKHYLCHNSTAQFHWNNWPTTGEQLSEDQMATMKSSQNNSRPWMIHLYDVLGVTHIHDYFLAMFSVWQTDQFICNPRFELALGL